jgi:hypothetical protein
MFVMCRRGVLASTSHDDRLRPRLCENAPRSEAEVQSEGYTGESTLECSEHSSVGILDGNIAIDS